MGLSRRPFLGAAAVLVFGVAGLLATAAVERLPTPRINVQWAESLAPGRRLEKERQYGLVNVGDGALFYALEDVSRTKVEAIVRDPDVADTHHIDRDRYVVRLYEGRGEWAAGRVYQALRLYDSRVRLLWFAVFAVVTGAGLIGAVRRRPAAVDRGVRRTAATVRQWRLRVGERFAAVERPQGDRTDIFGRLPDREGSGAIFPRLLVASLTIAALGLPILALWESLLLIPLLLAVIFGRPRRESWRWATAAALLAVALAGKAFAPRADIAEAHNAFMVSAPGGPLEAGLPRTVFEDWKERFESIYPPQKPVPAFSWRAHNAGPVSLYAQSADALWRPAKYTRQVDAIRFRGLEEFRAGFANEWHEAKGNLYNFWAGDLRRESMPFWVMYELTPASVGSTLAWRGAVYWETAQGGFARIEDSQVARRTITAADVGRRVYAIFFPGRADVYFELEPTWRLAAGGWLDAMLSLVAAVIIVALTIALRWGPWLRATMIVATSCLLVLSTAPGRWLAYGYAPYSGGDDGMVHDGWGRAMAQMAARGDVVEAMKGGEAIYWFTPGTRYVRMLEKMIFGDTNHLFVLSLAFIPLVLFYLVRHFLGPRGAWAVLCLFLLMPAGNLSFLHYIANARGGYGEAIGGGLFLLGLLMLLRAQPGWNGATPRPFAVWVGGAALAASMCIRPNFALAVVWVGAAFAWVSLRGRDVRTVVALAAGLGLALWMPLHNWYYGGELYLISRSGATVSVPLGVGDYLGAAVDALRGDVDTARVSATLQQLRGWLMDPGYVASPTWLPLAWLAHLAKLAGLLVAALVAVRSLRRRTPEESALAVVAVAALLAHAPMLFIFSTQYRYAMLAWDLSLMVLIVSAAFALRRGRAHNPGALAMTRAGAAG